MNNTEYILLFVISYLLTIILYFYFGIVRKWFNFGLFGHIVAIIVSVFIALVLLLAVIMFLRPI